MKNTLLTNGGYPLKIIIGFLLMILFVMTVDGQNNRRDENVKEINNFLDDWHGMAAVGDSTYFDFFDENSFYLGTDLNEVWTLQEFKDYAMPSFRHGSAWSFKKKNRNVYIGEYGHYAWVDETLDTWMGLCRGAGVLEKKEGKWVIKHYSLTVLISNKIIRDYIELLDKN